jgi:hypothetical protein
VFVVRTQIMTSELQQHVIECIWIRTPDPLTARDEFGLTQDEIVRAIRAGTLHCREGSMYGNPWLRFLRREVEALVRKKHGTDYLQDRQSKVELVRINRELKRLKAQVARLEERKSELLARLGR